MGKGLGGNRGGVMEGGIMEGGIMLMDWGIGGGFGKGLSGNRGVMG